MKTTRAVLLILCSLTLSFLVGCSGDSAKWQAENTALRAELEKMKADAEGAQTARAREIKNLQADTSEVARLRGEVTQLRTAAKDAEKLRAENGQLRAQNQQLRGANATVPAPAAPAAPVAEAGTFPRESWSQAGYASPEAALVSAIYSMQQGNPKQYFDSLTPEEQLRMTKVWEGKSQEEIAAKHQGDTSKITGMKVMDRQDISPDEVVMSVYIQGVDRMEKVSMKRSGQDWKFGGYLRPPAK